MSPKLNPHFLHLCLCVSQRGNRRQENRRDAGNMRGSREETRKHVFRCSFPLKRHVKHVSGTVSNDGSQISWSQLDGDGESQQTSAGWYGIRDAGRTHRRHTKLCCIYEICSSCCVIVRVGFICVVLDSCCISLKWLIDIRTSKLKTQQRKNRKSSCSAVKVHTESNRDTANTLEILRS